jgi:hypothetical protein
LTGKQRQTKNKNETKGGLLAMKKLLLIPSVTALALLCSPLTYGQAVVRESTTTTTTAAAAPMEVTGTVTEWAPGAVIIRQKDVAAPARFSFARTVEYVDAAGNRVAREVITPGVPVTVRYIRDGDQMLVDRVIVQRQPAATETSTTATTTTTTTVTGREAKEIEKLRGKIAHEERELAEHPDRTKLQEELDRDRAALDAVEHPRPR